MHHNHILIVDLVPNPCCSENRDQLQPLLQKYFPAEEIHVEAQITFELENISLAPDLIFLRHCLAVPISQTLHCMCMLREKWEGVRILGLFCAERDTPNGALSLLINELDDFVLCPYREIDLILRIRRLLRGNGLSEAARANEASKGKFRIESLVGESDCFVREIQKIPLLADSDTTVLISGETGTGKELFARAIHYHSPRKGKPFIPVNCGALPDQLFENELFGHLKGAFTNAFATQPGLVAEAEGGTLFLDEIDTLSLPAQTKLLRFLQDRQYRSLGSAKSISADVRIIAATNADLKLIVESGCFREDLFYRLNVLSLSVPPLRERIEDIPLLVARFVRQYGTKNSHGTVRVSSDALQKLLMYSWPGNVRELEGIIHRAMILTSSSVLHPDDLDLPIPYQSPALGTGSLRQAKACAVSEFERAYLTKLLAVSKGNITRAAKAAGKERRAFQRLLQKHHLDRHVFRELH